MLTRIHRLQGYRIFRDFAWPEELHDFGQYNVIYGWNGTGKTTLSTLFQHLQHREAVTEGKVEYAFGDRRVQGSEVDSAATPPVRVFNREFVSRSVFETSSGQFPPVYYFGEDSVEKQRQIAELDIQRRAHREEESSQGRLLDEATKAQEAFCTDQAKIIRTMLTATGGGKYNTFNAGPFKAEMHKLALSTDLGQLLSEEDRGALLQTKDSRPLPTIDQVAVRFPDLVNLRTKTDALLRKTVVSAVLKELTEDQAVASWVEQGLILHRGNRLSNHCRFCEQPLPQARVSALEAHFNDEFERQKSEVSELLAEVDAATNFAQNFVPPRT